VREILEEPGQGEGRPVDGPFEDKPVEALGAHQQLELQLLAVRLEEVGDGDPVDGFLLGGLRG
jgi:hypothetical protein